MVSNTLSDMEKFELCKENAGWVARKFRLSEEDGEDVAMEAYIAIVSEPLYRNGNPKAFVIRVLMNRAMDLASRHRMTEVSLSSDYDPVDTRDDLAEIFNEAILEMVRDIPLEDRLIITARLEKVPDRVLSRLMGCHINTIGYKRGRLAKKYPFLVP